MTPLRQQMIAAMRQRGFSVRTHESYLNAVNELARYYRRSPDRLRVDELQGFFNWLAQERELAPATCRLYLNGIRFVYVQVLGWSSFDVRWVVPRREQRIPELLTRSEVRRILEACRNPKHRTLLETTYGCGLRVSEAVSVRVRDIDGERRLLRVEQGKGAKDRMVVIAPTLLDHLRRYWSLWRPREWLFPSRRMDTAPMGVTTAQRVFTQAKARAGVERVGGIHSLRHAYAMHQLEQGLPVHELQHLLGHTNRQSTQRYVHWLPGHVGQGRTHGDLLASPEVRHD